MDKRTFERTACRLLGVSLGEIGRSPELVFRELESLLEKVLAD